MACFCSMSYFCLLSNPNWRFLTFLASKSHNFDQNWIFVAEFDVSVKNRHFQRNQNGIREANGKIHSHTRMYVQTNKTPFYLLLHVKTFMIIWRRGNFRIFRFGYYWTDYRICIRNKKNFLGSFKQEMLHFTFSFSWSVLATLLQAVHMLQSNKKVEILECLEYCIIKTIVLRR